MNKVLLRQLKRLKIKPNSSPPDPEMWNKLLETISTYYSQCEEDRYLLERSLDISSREMEEKIAHNKKISLQLAQASKLAAIGTLASGIAHELNNPLQIINGFAELTYLRALKNDHSLVIPYAKKIKTTVDRMSSTIKYLLKLSRQDEDEGVVLSCIKTPILETVDLMKNQLKFDNIELILDFDDSTCNAEINSGLFCGVIHNLIANSRDAFLTSTEPVENKYIKINIKVSSQDESIFLLFEDNAGGIPEQHLQNIFDPFYTTKDINEGTGLGLSLSRQTIEGFKGQLDVSVIEGRTIFKITLPIAKVTDSVTSLSKIDRQKDTFQNILQKRFKALIIDDEPDICQIYEKGLVNYMDVTTTCLPEDGLRLMTENFYDVIITDLKMPKISGEQVATKMRTLSPQSKLVFISGNIQSYEPEYLKKYKPYLLIEKPVPSMIDLTKKIQNFLNDDDKVA